MRPRLAAAAALFAGLVLLGCAKKGGPPSGPGGPDTGPPLVTAARPLVKTVTQFIDVNGTMKAVRRVEVRPQVGGYIQKVHFTDGSDVRKGDVLVTIQPGLYAADVRKAEGDLKNAEAQVKLATAEETRYKRLQKEGAASADEFEKAAAEKGVREGNVTSAAATLDRARQNLAYTNIIAPIDGRVDRILVTEGNLVAGGVAASAPVLTVITSMDPIYAYFDIDEQTVQYYGKLINAGKFTSVRDARIPVDLQVKDEVGYRHKGYLTFAGAEMNPTTGTLQLRAEVPTQPVAHLAVGGGVANKFPAVASLMPRFTPGMFVNARLPGQRLENAVLIPDSAVVIDQEKKIVFVVGPDNRASARPVGLGPLTEGLRVVLSGVKPDDCVVLRGQQRLQDGIPVEVEAGKVTIPDAADLAPPVPVTPPQEQPK